MIFVLEIRYYSSNKLSFEGVGKKTCDSYPGKRTKKRITCFSYSQQQKKQKLT